MRMKLRRHPPADALRAWLETGAPERIGDHVAECERCLAAVERSTALDGALVAGLTDAVAAPADLTARTNAGVERRLRDEEALTTFLDLFAAAWPLAGIVFDTWEDFDG